MLLLLLWSSATASAQAAGSVVAVGSDGSYAVAAPGLSMGPVLAGGSVVWTTSDARSRLLRVEQAGPGRTSETLYATPRRFRDSIALTLAASPTRVVVVRDEDGAAGSCNPLTLRCTIRSDGALLAGEPGKRLRRVVGVAERFRRYRGCRRGTMSIEREVALQLSGDVAGYERRVACRDSQRPDLLELVLHDLRTGTRRVVARTRSSDGNGAIQLAGRFAAYRSAHTGRYVVADIRTGAIRYTPVRRGGWDALDEQGTLAGATFRSGSFNAWLNWTSPTAPWLHRLPVKTSIFSSEPYLIAKRRIAYVRGLGWDGYELAVTDLRGHAQIVARFERPEELDDFAFDGDRIAWVSSIWRPYAGRQDDGLPYRCDNGIRVLVRAPVIEVHPIEHPARMPSDRLPQHPVLRDPERTPPFCPTD